MKTIFRSSVFAALGFAAILFAGNPARSQNGYQIFVSNEKSGDLTVISGSDFKVTATIPVGKRPRGIHASPDGRIVYVALSGTPIEPPPQLDASGNPILKKNSEDDDAKARADKSADGIGLVDAAQKKFLRKIPAGSDPEQFVLSADGSRIYIANEDVSAATILNATNGKVITFVPVSREPEGVGISPDGRFFYVTCETAGDVFAIDAKTCKVIGHLQLHPRPRSVAFLPDGSRAFIPSESTGELNVIDTTNHTLLKVVALPKGSRPMTVLVSPDGKKIYASTGRGGTVVVLDANTYELLNTIPVGKRPWGLAFSPDGKFLFTANGPSDDVSVVDLATEKEIARVKSPGSPWGIVAVPDADANEKVMVQPKFGSTTKHETTVVGLVNLDAFKAAILEFRDWFPNHSHFITTRQTVRAGECFEDEQIKGAHIKIEIVRIDFTNGVIEAREDGNDTAYHFNAEANSNDDLKNSRLRLNDVGLDSVFDLYETLSVSRRTLLMHPSATRKIPVSMRVNPRNKVEAAQSLKSMLNEKGFAVIPDGNKFEMIVPNELVNDANPHATNLSVSKTGEADSNVMIDFQNVPFEQVRNFYAKLSGREIVQAGVLPPLTISLHPRNPLTKSELLYALDVLLGWQGVKVVNADEKTSKIILLR